MTTVYLHIGLPKTATSTVQGAIQKLRPLLDPKGYWTPLGIMAHHRFAIEALDKSDPRFAWSHYQRVLASGNDAVVSEVKAAVRERKHILISSEYLNDCGPQATARLLAQFGVHARDVRIIVCLRRQDRFLESIYNQEVKGAGRTRPLVWSPRQASPWDWYAKLSAWAGEFGDAALRVLVFERVTREAPVHLFTKAVLEACDLKFEEADINSLASAADDYINASLPAELLEFKRIANTVTQNSELDWFIGKAMAARTVSTRYRMSKSLAAEIVAYYQVSNAEVARRFLKEPGPLFDELLDGDDAAPAPLDTVLLSQLIALIAAEIGAQRGNRPGSR